MRFFFKKFSKLPNFPIVVSSMFCWDDQRESNAGLAAGLQRGVGRPAVDGIFLVL